MKKIARPGSARARERERENVDGIPNNMILMSWKIPGPPEDCPDATVVRTRYCFSELRLPSLPLITGTSCIT